MLLEFTDYNFDNLVSATSELVLIDFWSPWCRPCNMMNPIIHKLSESGDVAVGKLNTSENPTITAQFSINAIPAILFFKEGKLVRRLLGYQTEAQLQKHINELK